METTGDAKDVAGPRPLAVAIPSKRGVVLIGRDFTPSPTRSRPGMPPCPAYRFCRESRGPYRPMFDSDHDQQITALHDLLQAIREAALRLIQLISSDAEKRRRRDADSRAYPDSRYERSEQSRSPGSRLIATTTSSVCALCGVALHLKDSSAESRQFAVDKERNDDYILSKHLDNILSRMAHKVPPSAKKSETSDDFLVPGSILDYILPKENDIINKRARGRREEKISSKTQSTNTSESGLTSKLFFVRRTPSGRTVYQKQDECDSASQVPRYTTSQREYNDSNHIMTSNQCVVNIPSTISSTQDASTFTRELCPCACGLLVTDGTESEISINPVPIKDKLIKTKLEELGHLDSKKKTHMKVHDGVVKIKTTKRQKLEKDINVTRWIEEIVQLRLQMQIEELHKNIQFFKQENEYIRCLAEKCRCLSEDIKGLQQLLPIRDTYSGLTTTIKHLQTKYHEHGIIATLTGMFRGTVNIQQIAARLLAPILEHWNPRDNIMTTHVSSASRAQAPLRPPSSIVLDVY